MIIDCHAHAMLRPLLRRLDGNTHLSDAEVVALMDKRGIAKSVILPTGDQSIGEVLEMCERFPGRFIPFCNFDPRQNRRPGYLTTAYFDFQLEQYKALGCRGFGEWTTRIPWEDPAALALLEACEKIGFPVTFHTTSPAGDGYGVIDEIGLPGLERMLGRFPDLNFFGHSTAFWSEIAPDVTQAQKDDYPTGAVRHGGRVPELLRRYPNLYGDLSAGSGLNALKRDLSHAREFLDEFQDRLLLGLDQCSLANPMQHVAWFEEALASGWITQNAWEKIAWRNLDRLLGLGLATG